MKKIMLALVVYIGLNACNGGGSSENVVVDSLPLNDTSLMSPSDTVYPRTDTAALNRAPEKPNKDTPVKQQ